MILYIFKTSRSMQQGEPYVNYRLRIRCINILCSNITYITLLMQDVNNGKNYMLKERVNKNFALLIFFNKHDEPLKWKLFKMQILHVYQENHNCFNMTSIQRQSRCTYIDWSMIIVSIKLRHKIFCSLT